MWCYRLHGHNEGDDPSYTQPLMYKAIGEHRSVRKLYVEALVKRGDITLDEAEQALADFQGKLQVALDETRAAAHRARSRRPGRRSRSACCRTSRRASTASTLDRIFDHLTAYPESFEIHPKLGRQFDARTKLYEQGEVEWATAEALAFGSLLLEGHSVRLAGEDSRRGTFSQRHAALVDYATGKPWVPLTDLDGRGGHVLGLRLAAVGVRRARLRVRLRPQQPRGARAVGGAVRRLHQLRPGHRRPVPRRRRGQVGPAQRARAAAAARLRGPGPGALVGAHRALPDGRRRGQHADLQRHDGGAVLPPAAPPGAHRAAHAADPVHAEAGPADEADPLADRRADAGLVRGDPRRPRA